jgi:hypothetical protein
MMLSKMRQHLTFANVVAAVALFVAIGGGAFAVASSQSQQDRRIARKVVRKLAPKLSVKHALTAGSATNAANLEGAPASDYRLHCAAGLHRGTDLCFEDNERAPAPYTTALKTCALARRRLPDEGELAVVFDNLGAPQDEQWVVSHYYVSRPNQSDQVVASLLAEDPARTLLLNGDLVSKEHAYRCVTSATN